MACAFDCLDAYANGCGEDYFLKYRWCVLGFFYYLNWRLEKKVFKKKYPHSCGQGLKTEWRIGCTDIVPSRVHASVSAARLKRQGCILGATMFGVFWPFNCLQQSRLMPFNYPTLPTPSQLLLLPARPQRDGEFAYRSALPKCSPTCKLILIHFSLPC